MIVDRPQRRGPRTPGIDRLQLLQSTEQLRQRRLIELSLPHQRFVRMRRGDHRHAVLRPDLPYDLGSCAASAVEGHRGRGLVPHAEGVVQDDYAAGPPREPQHPGEIRPLPDRPRDGKDQRHHGQRAQRQENPLLDFEPPPIGLDRQLEVLHRCPVNPDEPLAVQQVNDDRRTGEQQTEQQAGEEEGHGEW